MYQIYASVQHSGIENFTFKFPWGEGRAVRPAGWPAEQQLHTGRSTVDAPPLLPAATASDERVPLLPPAAPPALSQMSTQCIWGARATMPLQSPASSMPGSAT